MKLYIAGIHPDAKKTNFQNFIFRKIGDFRMFVWLTRKFAGYFIGSALVEFVNDADNELALKELNGAIFMDRKLRVKPAHPRPSKSE